MRHGDVAVHVPAAEVQRDEADAGLAQPAGHQQVLAEALAVAVADARVFAGHVEGVAGLAEDEVEGLGVEAVEAGHAAAAVDGTIQIVEVS